MTMKTIKLAAATLAFAVVTLAACAGPEAETRPEPEEKPAPQLSEALDDLAAQLSAYVPQDSTRVELNFLGDTEPQALDLLADVLLNPAFRAEDIERVRMLTLTELKQKAGNPSVLAHDEMS